MPQSIAPTRIYIDKIMGTSSEEASRILKARQEQLDKLHEIVLASIKEEDSIVKGLGEKKVESTSVGQNVSDKVARFGGSWTFIITFLIILFCWISYNAVLPKDQQFDPYPFILMNLVLSCVAALQAPIIMMSQNRQEEKDRERAMNDYMINLKAELELRGLHQKVDLLQEEQLKTLFETQAKQMELLTALEKKIGILESRLHKSS